MTSYGRDQPRLGRNAPASSRARSRAVRHGRIFGVGTGQLVSTQIAAVLLLVAVLRGTVAVAAAAVIVVVLMALTWLRWRGRWAFEWFGTAMRYAGRRRSVGIGGSATALLEHALPGARIEEAELAGDPSAVIVDGHGLTAVLELGDPIGLLAEEHYPLPSPISLLPPPGAEHPPCRIQLLVTGVPAPTSRTGNDAPGNSYRQLTEGRLPGHSRALLAVRVLHAEGWATDDLRRSLSSLIRKIRQRLGEVPARPLGEVAALRAVAELAHEDGPGFAEESWSDLRIGSLRQTTYRVRRWPDPRAEGARRSLMGLLSVPSAATTVAITAGPHPETGRSAATSPEAGPFTAVDLTVRLAARHAGDLTIATHALREALAAEHAQAHRLDGEHLDGLIATLPLGGGPVVDVPGRPAADVLPADVLDGLELSLGAAGLMAGRNRRGDPVVVRLFRPEQTRVLLVGGVHCAQLLTLRAMAVGARVVVQTTRSPAWEPFVRGVAVPGDSITVVPPGRAVQIPAGSALHPLLVVVDVGPVGDTRPGPSWQATLVVRDEFGPADVDAASRADLLILQPLRPEEASLVGAAVGLGETTQWLTRIRPAMVGLVNRRAVRWAALAPTPIESQLIGPPVRG